MEVLPCDQRHGGDVGCG
uniref:Uncharacterized protein n=1 Tax=Arundo donax TaxID=35708 RepID=A0A0A9B5Z7_ARUDO